MQHDNWQATEYAKVADMQYRHAMEVITRVKFKSTDIILDVGCGDGKITKYLAGQVPQGKVIGIDLTTDMIDYATYKYKEVANLSFEQISADSLPYRDKFNLIFSFSCLHWVSDQTSVWNQL